MLEQELKTLAKAIEGGINHPDGWITPNKFFIDELYRTDTAFAELISSQGFVVPTFQEIPEDKLIFVHLARDHSVSSGQTVLVDVIREVLPYLSKGLANALLSDFLHEVDPDIAREWVARKVLVEAACDNYLTHIKSCFQSGNFSRMDASALGRILFLSHKFQLKNIFASAYTECVSFLAAKIAENTWPPQGTRLLSYLASRFKYREDHLSVLTAQLMSDLIDRGLLETDALKKLSAVSSWLKPLNQEIIDKTNRSYIESLLMDADDSPAISAHVILMNAIDKAQERGYTDLAERAKVKAQNVDNDTIEWSEPFSQPVWADSTLPHLAEQFDKSKGLVHNLTQFAGLPFVDADQIKQEAQEGADSLVFAKLFTGITLGAHGSVERMSPAFSDGYSEMLVHVMSVYYGQLYGMIDHVFSSSLEESLSSQDFKDALSLIVPGKDDHLVMSIAVCLDLYNQGQYWAATHLALAKLEYAVRSILRGSFPLYSLERGTSPGRYVALDRMVEIIDTQLGDSDFMLLFHWLIDPPPSGLNLRNMSAHGEMRGKPASILLMVIKLMIKFSFIRISDGTPTEETDSTESAG